jgi:ADP-ribose pyrophosphatase YjhB (NUDIX family)
MRFRGVGERILITWDFAKGLIILAFAVIAALAMITWFLSGTLQASRTLFFWAIAFPVGLAVLTTLAILTVSPYMTIATELGRKRLHQTRAGLAFITSDTHKVLLVRQTEHPWINMWIMPGGYHNPGVGDRFLKDTAERRVRVALGNDSNLVARACLAKTNGSRAYRMALIDIGYVPVTDEVYLMTNPNDSPIQEKSVAGTENMRWFTCAEVKDSNLEVPPHMRELLLHLLGASGSSGHPKFWTLQDDYENYLLQQVQVTEVNNATT